MVDAGMLRGLSTLVEIIVLALLVASYAVIKGRYKGRIKVHWYMLTAAVLLNALAVIVLMLPRFLTMADGYSSGGLDARAWIVIIHHTLGLIGLILSFYIMVPFLNGSGEMKRCPTRNKTSRRLMVLTYVLLIVPLVIGLYLRFYQF